MCATRLDFQLFTAHAKSLRAVTQGDGVHAPEFASFDWRLDVQLATRTLRGLCEPRYVLELSRTDGSKTLFESDYASLVHLRDALEAALAQSTDAHARRALRYVK